MLPLKQLTLHSSIAAPPAQFLWNNMNLKMSLKCRELGHISVLHGCTVCADIYKFTQGGG